MSPLTQSYLTYLKSYMKKTKAALQTKADAGDENAKARLATFETAAGAFAKKMIGNFKDYEFFTGESMDPDGMVVLMNYREDGITPYMIFWKDGLREVSRERVSAMIFLIVHADAISSSHRSRSKRLIFPDFQSIIPKPTMLPLHPYTIFLTSIHLFSSCIWSRRDITSLALDCMYKQYM